MSAHKLVTRELWDQLFKSQLIVTLMQLLVWKTIRWFSMINLVMQERSFINQGCSSTTTRFCSVDHLKKISSNEQSINNLWQLFWTSDMCLTTVRGWVIWKNIYDNMILLILIDTCIIIFHFLQGIFRTETNDLEWEYLAVQAIGYGSSPEGDYYIIGIHVVGVQQSLRKMWYSVCLSLSYHLLD